MPGSAASAQDTTRARVDTGAVRRDSAAQDSAAAARARARADSIARARQEAIERERADSIKPPIARAPVPAPISIGAPLDWGRDGIAATGALTLGELLERVPGVTVYRTGWIASPEMVAYNGAFGRVRVFYDGIELDALDPRTGGLLDFSFIEMWQLENAVIELCAGLRVEASGRREAPGVYVGGRKLASIGLRVRRGGTYHGIALNVLNDLEPFSRINPCGYAGLQVTRLADLARVASLDQVARRFEPILVRHLLGLRLEAKS